MALWAPIADKRMLKLIRAFLTAGREGKKGLGRSVDEGTPQGVSLSPLLSNLVRANWIGSWSGATLLREVRGRLQHLRAQPAGRGTGEA